MITSWTELDIYKPTLIAWAGKLAERAKGYGVEATQVSYDEDTGTAMLEAGKGSALAEFGSSSVQPKAWIENGLLDIGATL